jgi:hypothetical protein
MRASISLVDETLRVEIFYDPGDCDFKDNICISILEDCPPAEKLFQVGETNLYITAEQARKLAQALLSAVEDSEQHCPEQSADEPGGAG